MKYMLVLKDSGTTTQIYYTIRQQAEMHGERCKLQSPGVSYEIVEIPGTSLLARLGPAIDNRQ